MGLILGLDVSTACTGWCILEKSGKLIDIGVIFLGKKEGLYKKAETVKRALSDLFIKHPIKNVYIEENLQAFRPGLSSARTLSVLARFNGMVSLLCYEVFDLEPIHLNVNAARKALGIKLIRKKHGGKPTKHQIFEWVSDQVELERPGYQWPMKILKSGPRKGEEILDFTTYDMTDAYVIARAALVQNLEQ
jgi:Holliday junction resolvasome RuvABC endonuclease subunit